MKTQFASSPFVTKVIFLILAGVVPKLATGQDQPQPDTSKQAQVAASNKNGSQSNNNRTVVDLSNSFPQKMVEVTLTNDSGSEAALCRVNQSDLTVVTQIPADGTAKTYKLPSAIYTVTIDSKPVLPVPAVYDLLDDTKTLSVTVTLPAINLTDYWRWIPAGPTIVGDTLGVGAEDERPVRIENTEGFWISVAEVSNQDYASFLNSRIIQNKKIPANWIDFESKKCRIQKTTNSDGKVEYTTDKPDFPVVMVSFAGAKAYCDESTQLYNTTYRLPTEVEWEKAARGPELFVYSYGNVYKRTSANQESGSLKKIKSYQPNGYGLYDMTGNVFEWMSNPYKMIPGKDGGTMNQCLRGGSFVLDGMYLRNSFRMRQSPTVMTDDIGFRVINEGVSRPKTYTPSSTGS